MNESPIMMKRVENTEIEIPNVIELGNNSYHSVMDIQNLILLIGKQYNHCFETTVTNKHRYFECNDFNIVSELTEDILNDESIAFNTFYINVLMENNRELNFDNRELTIAIDSEISLLEGYSQYLAFEKALEIEPNLKQQVTVMITYRTIEGLHEWFAQRSKEI